MVIQGSFIERRKWKKSCDRKGGVNDLKKYLRKNPLTINSWVTRLHRLVSIEIPFSMKAWHLAMTTCKCAPSVLLWWWWGCWWWQQGWTPCPAGRGDSPWNTLAAPPSPVKKKTVPRPLLYDDDELVMMMTMMMLPQCANCWTSGSFNSHPHS